MKFFCKIVGVYLLLIVYYVQAQPMVRSIKNNTPFMFQVIGHNDMSDCSDFNQGQKIQIKPFTLLEKSFLLGYEKPGLILRPVGYFDKKTDIYYSFINDDEHFDQKKLEKAFQIWKKNHRYKKDVHHWLTEWLCGDIYLIHNHIEVFGYLLNTSLTRVENNKNYHVCMIDYSEGLFSKLFLDITIEQKYHKGIIPYVKSFVGQGGFCQNGNIVILE